MPLFQIRNSKASQVPVDLKHFKDEAALRDFFADNLEGLLGLRLLAKEQPTRDGRIDTLAIDETGAPVILEYKWGEKDNILSQGLFYLGWLRESKKFIDLLVADRLGKQIKVNWDSPRVILVAQGFDRYTLAAVREVKNVELIKYTPYSSAILFLENVYSPVPPKGAGAIVAKTGTPELSIAYHLGSSTAEIKRIFQALQKFILTLPNVEEKADQKTGITYRTTKSFLRCEFGMRYIDLLLRDSQYDPRGLVKNIASYEWGYKGRVKLKSLDEVEYAFSLVKQSYDSTL
jgi:predicted transport protein